MTTDLPFLKKELTVVVLNPMNLPVIDFHNLKDLQGDLKITTPAKIEKLKNSIIKYGVFVPKFIWIDNGVYHIEDGHQTIKALTELEKGGYTVPPIPYVEIQAKDRKDAGEKLLMINSRFAEINSKTTFFSDFDIDVSFINDIEIPELDLAFEDLDSTPIEEDEVPDVPEEAITRVGDLWACGSHRVLCGDCTKAEDVERLMDGEKCDCVLTDPPYGIKRSGIMNDNPEITSILYTEMLKHTPMINGIVASFQSPRLFIKWMAALEETKYSFERALWMYDETDITYPWRGWLMCSQIILLASKGKPNWNDIKPYVHDCYLNKTAGREGEGAEHPSIKPLPVVVDILKRISNKGNCTYDPFLASGTTLIAADQLNRICYGMEIEPKYVDVILERYVKLTGNDPIREDGKKWSELKSI